MRSFDGIFVIMFESKYNLLLILINYIILNLFIEMLSPAVLSLSFLTLKIILSA